MAHAWWVRDACFGDSGGPIVRVGTNTSSAALVGVVSWGIGCGRAGYPGVYTNVSHYMEWICSFVDSDSCTQYMSTRRGDGGASHPADEEDGTFVTISHELATVAEQQMVERGIDLVSLRAKRQPQLQARIFDGRRQSSTDTTNASGTLDKRVNETTARIVNGQSSHVALANGVSVGERHFGFYTPLASPSGVIFCGASMITRRHAITAAHCVKSYLYQLYVGKRVRSNSCEAPSCRAYPIDAVLVHPSYGGLTSLENDIAIVRTAYEVVGGDGRPIEPVVTSPLSEDELVRQAYVADEELVIAGFGALSEKGSSYAAELQIASVPLVSSALCESTPVGYYLKRGMFCAGMLHPPPSAPPPSPPPPPPPTPPAPPASPPPLRPPRSPPFTPPPRVPVPKRPPRVPPVPPAPPVPRVPPVVETVYSPPAPRQPPPRQPPPSPYSPPLPSSPPPPSPPPPPSSSPPSPSPPPPPSSSPPSPSSPPPRESSPLTPQLSDVEAYHDTTEGTLDDDGDSAGGASPLPILLGVLLPVILVCVVCVGLNTPSKPYTLLS